ncbi:MAG: biotin--[acetyl-CoA-carboxylase] ligase [Chloroherpetonaceae bacterium]|nr:biotin--[acetyl-CoA-carboxylase] ligase [Chthonomonadaceae bacterium]MDW8208667.1 biotin--[acetyl-CoA-carboxylase] ligase [Chloroherpetonaceae bacterium]
MYRIIVDVHDRVTSTMDVARENVRSGRVCFDSAGRPHPAGVIAREQIAGRGQRGRDWYAEPGANLNATYYFRHPRTHPEQAGTLALLAGVAVLDVLLPLCTPAMAGAPAALGLKWPNDLLLNRRKLGGILIEMIQAPDQDWVALIGVGINLSTTHFPDGIARLATSLHREGLPCPDWRTLGEQVPASLCLWASIWREQGPEAILERWRAFDQTPGRHYATEIEGQTVAGVAVGVDTQGALLLALPDARVLSIHTATSLREQDQALSHHVISDVQKQCLL